MTKPLSERIQLAMTQGMADSGPCLSVSPEVFALLREAAALARRVEGALTTEAIAAGWRAKAAVYDDDKCNESDLHAWVLRDCANELVSGSGQRVRLVPEVGDD